MASFALFIGLPLEIQDKIWEAAIPPPTPTAFHAQLARQPMGRAEDGSIDSYNTKDRVLLYRIPTTTPSDLADRDCVMATLSSMLVACRRSHAVAKRAYKALVKPAHPFLLRGQDSLDPYYMEIDAVRDLVILTTGWQWPCRLISTSTVFRLQVPTPLRYLGLFWPGPSRQGLSGGRSAFNYSEALNGLLALWGSLRALYVVVDPVHLRDAERPWPAPAHRQWSSISTPNSTVLEDYLASYGSDPRGELPDFQSGGRRYHEVPAAQVARSGGLVEVVELLESARRRLAPSMTDAQNQGQHLIATEREPVRCGVMTWRHE